MNGTAATLERPHAEVKGDGDPGTLLARGLFEEARASARRARRRPAAGRPRSMLALMESDALDALGRDADALAVATRALAQGVADPDLAVRLRVARARSLWHTGRPAPAAAEARRALAHGEVGLSRGRALETLARIAASQDDLENARDCASQALMLFEAAGCRTGAVRVLGTLAGIERAAWRLEDTLRLEDRRAAMAEGLAPHLVSAARVERADLLAALGRWREAAAELDQVESHDRRAAESPAARLVRAHLARSRGDLGLAQRTLALVRETAGTGARLRVRIECHLLASDVTLAGGDVAAAEREALDAMRLSGVLGERSARSRSRVRRVHALLAADRVDEAAVEARRALADAGAARPELQAHAGLALARAVWRRRPADAARVCRVVAERSHARAGFHAVALFGEALAGGSPAEAVLDRLGAVEAWGDRRVLAYCLTELRHGRVFGQPLAVADAPASVTATAASVDPLTRGLLDAAHAMAGEGPWAERWVEAVRALGPALPWRRAALVGVPGVELRRDDEHARPLAASDLARLVVARSGGRRVIPLAADAELRLHPTRALLGLAAAVLAPAGEGWLYFDLEESHADVSEGLVAVVGELGRLLERFAPDRNPAPADAEPAAVAGLVGGSDRMRLLFETIARAARFDMTVHVCGETGTGKERVAHALHQRSARAPRPFVAVNASSLSDELFESEMFGHLRGSFTGAVADREGHVAAAEGGTLFLDEITDLSPRAQAKLLRLLEAKEYRRVGESRTRTADVRFVTASNVPLEQRVAEGRFRADLMYRLQRMVLSVPPLRERGDDVLLLARHFLRRAAGRSGVPLPALAGDAERALRAHAWPGNVRELENAMDRLVVIGATGRVRRQDLAPALQAPPTPPADSLREAIRGFEREHIARVLRRHGGNRTRAACLLGLTRQALVAKISRLGIETGAPR